MNKIFNYTLLTGIFFHLIFAIWIYGNPDIFPTSSNAFNFLNVIKNALENVNVFINNNIGDKIASRLTLTHNILILIVLAAFILYFILRYVFYNLIKSLFCCCCTKTVEEEETDIVIFDAVNISDLYKSYQIKKLEYKYFTSDNQNSKLTNLKKFYEDSIYIYRHYIVKKLKENNKEDKNLLSDTKILNLKQNFEAEIKNVFKDNFKGEMKGEGSYNLAFQIEFEGFAFKYLTQGINKKKTEKIILEENMKEKVEEKVNNKIDFNSNNFKSKEEEFNNSPNKDNFNSEENDKLNKNRNSNERHVKNYGSISQQRNLEDSNKKLMETNDFNKSNAALINEKKRKIISEFSNDIKQNVEEKNENIDVSLVSEFKIENQNEVDKATGN